MPYDTLNAEPMWMNEYEALSPEAQEIQDVISDTFRVLIRTNKDLWAIRVLEYLAVTAIHQTAAEEALKKATALRRQNRTIQ